MMKREVINLGAASRAPLSAGIKVGHMLYTSGQVPVNRETQEVPGSIAEQTRQTLENLKDILHAAGTDFDQVIKVLVFLTDMADFEGMNEVYREYFPVAPPARSTIGVAGLARDEFKVEIELIALVP